MESSPLLTAEPPSAPARPAPPDRAGRRRLARPGALSAALLLISACTAVHALDSVGVPVGGRSRVFGPGFPPGPPTAPVLAAALGFACALAMALTLAFARRERGTDHAAAAAAPRPLRPAVLLRGVPGAVDG